MAGWVEKRGENTWRLNVPGGTGPDGKRKTYRKVVEAPSERQAKKLLDVFSADVQNGQYIEPSKLTLKAFSERWLRDYGENNLAPKTLHRYREILNSRILPAIGHLKLEQIKPMHLLELYKNLAEEGIRLDGKYKAQEKLINDIKKNEITTKELAALSGVDKRTIAGMIKGKTVSKKVALSVSNTQKMDFEELFEKTNKLGGLSESTILQHHRIIHSILDDAVQWQIIRDNPAARISPPKTKRIQATCYDKEQTATLLAALDEELLHYKMMVILALTTGLRRGELMGLEWKDVDFERKTIEVSRASQYLKDAGIFTKGTKNVSSSRLIAVPASVIALLKQHKAQQNEDRLKVGDRWQDSDRLFTAWDGKPMFPDTISNWFPKFLKRHGLPHIKFHALRHTSATLLIAEGVPLKNVSSRLGHTNISTTVDIYAHALRSVDQEAAEKMDILITNGKKQGQV